jgi:hypothetical protein
MYFRLPTVYDICYLFVHHLTLVIIKGTRIILNHLFSRHLIIERKNLNLLIFFYEFVYIFASSSFF